MRTRDSFEDQLCHQPKISRIDEKLIDNVKLNIAHTAYKLRWANHCNEVSSCPTRYEHIRCNGCSFQRPFASAPPTYNVNIEDSLKQLSVYVVNQIRNTTFKSNLNHDHAKGLKSLIAKRESLHISVSDKSGEFVVTNRDAHKALTEHHLSSAGVYKYVPPTRTYSDGRGIQPISSPTDITFLRQIKTKAAAIESECNTLWSIICKKHNFDSKTLDLFCNHNSQLPKMYVLLKTHKFDAGDISCRDEILNICKIRPIVSCCGSPAEKLSYVCTQILSPLLNFVPSHLQHVYKHIESLQALAPEQLQGLQFYTADVVSLYTNIDMGKCLDDIIEFAAEHIEHLDLWGLSLTEVLMILDLALSRSFFTFNNRLYQQLVGLFMGCRPSPLAAVIQIFSFERLSIYTNTYYLSNPVHLFFGRYLDDLGSLSSTREKALETLNRISDMDPDGLSKWELDFPESCQHFVPFLSTQIRIDEESILHHKYYRKSQKKDITINFCSHHPLNTKLLTARNFYTSAKACTVVSHIYTYDRAQNILNFVQPLQNLIL